MTTQDLAVHVVDLIHGEPQRRSQQGRAAIARGHDMREEYTVYCPYVDVGHIWVGSFCNHVAHTPQMWLRRVARETVR